MRSGFALGWLQVAICFLLLAADALITSVYSVVAAPLDDEFHPPRFVLMLAITIVMAVTAILSPVLGGMMDRVPLRRLMVLGSVWLAAGYAVLALATQFWQVLLIFGLFMAPANILIGPIAATVLLSRWFVKRRGTAIGIAIAGVAAGAIIFPPIVKLLLDNFAWRQAFVLLGLVLLVFAAAPAMLVINRPADRGLHPDGIAQDPRELPAAVKALPSITSLEVLRDPTFWMVCAVIAVVTSGMVGMISNMAQLVLAQGMSLGEAAGLITVYGASGFVAKASFAVISDRVPLRALIFASLLGFAAGMVCLTQAHHGFMIFAVAIALVGLFGGLMVPMQSLLAPRIFGDDVVGKAMGLISMVSLVALLSTPPVFGGVFDLTGSYIPIFWGEAALALVTLMLVPYIRLHPRERALQAVAA